MIDPELFGKAISEFINDAISPLIKRIKELESVEVKEVDIDAIALKAAGMIKLPEPIKQPEPVNLKAADFLTDEVKSSFIGAISADFERRFSEMSLHWERNSVKSINEAIAKFPEPINGKDAVQIEELLITQEGRNLKLKLGDNEHSIKIDSIIYKGIFKPSLYEKGDAVTYGGNLWIAGQDNPTGKPGNSKHWQLAVKKGRDGKDLRDNASKINAGESIKL